MDIIKIIEESKLIKDDSVQVFKYKEEFIIKKRLYSEELEKSIYVEKEFLEYASSNGISIHQIINIIKEWDFLYIIYNFITPIWELNFEEIWRNFKLLHSLDKTFNFSKGNNDDLDFIWAEVELKEILWESILQKWKQIWKVILKEYELKLQQEDKFCIVHWDFDFWNIIAPYTIIDTEEMRMGVFVYDIVAFFRMWYRYWNMKAMNKLLEWYWYKWTLKDVKEYFWYKDFTVTNWLILNNKWDKNRIQDIKSRIENWGTWDYKWVLYS